MSENSQSLNIVKVESSPCGSNSMSNGINGIEGADDPLGRNGSVTARLTPQIIEVENMSRERDEAICQRDECHEQILALLEFVSLLSKLAAMDPTRYCSRSRPRSSTRPSSREDCDEYEIKGSPDAEEKISFRRLVPESASGKNQHKGEFITTETPTLASTETGDSEWSVPEDSDIQIGKDLDKNRCASVGLAYHNVLPLEADGIDKDSAIIQRRIDTLQTMWMLEDTAIPSLLTSVHRIQSNLASLQSELDSATVEIHALHQSLSECQNREQRLENALKKVYKQNKDLKERLAKKCRDKKAFVSNMKKAVSGMKMFKNKEEEVELEERRVANGLRVHESMLRMGSLSNKSNVNPTNAHLSLEEIDKSKSFLDVDYVHHHHRRNVAVRKDFESIDDVSTSYSSVEDIDVISVGSSVDSSTVLVDVNGVATVRLVPTKSFPPPLYKRRNGEHKDIDECIFSKDVSKEDGLNWNSVKTTFGLGTIDGLGSTRTRSFTQTSSISADDLNTDAERDCVDDIGGRTIMRSGRDRAASADDVLTWSSVKATIGIVGGQKMSMIKSSKSIKEEEAGDRSKEKLLSHPTSSARRFITQLRTPIKSSLHIHKLKFPRGKKVGLQLQKVPLNVTNNHLLNTEETVSFSHNQHNCHEPTIGTTKSPFQTDAADVSIDPEAIGFHIDSFLLGDRSMSYDSLDPVSFGSDFENCPSECMFLVCGHNGFDESINIRPTVGARLIAINGESLEKGRWSFKRILDAMQGRAIMSSSNGSRPSIFTMSFRNESLVKEQVEILEKAIITLENKNTEEKERSFCGSVGVGIETDNSVTSVRGGTVRVDALQILTTTITAPSQKDTSDTINNAPEECKNEPFFLQMLSRKKENYKDMLQECEPPQSSPHSIPATASLSQQPMTPELTNTKGYDGFEDKNVFSSSPLTNQTTKDDILKKKDQELETPLTDDFKISMKAMSKRFKAFF